MPNLSQMEFNAIREVCTCHINAANKLGEYAQNCTDSTIKQMFQKASTDARSAAQKLCQML